MFGYEILFNKKYITKEEWWNFITTIANFNGLFKKWRIIMTNNQNNIAYYLQTKCCLPPTINNLTSFLLKPAAVPKYPQELYAYLGYCKIGCNLIDLINYLEIKNKGNVKIVVLDFRKIYEDKVKCKVTYYLEKNNIIKKYHLVLGLPTCILAVDFGSNKRYFYHSVPKYLEVNKVLNYFNQEENQAVLALDAFPYSQGKYYVHKNNYDFFKHTIILGSSGSGKSKLISLLIKNLYLSHNSLYKVVVIDPHASLENDIGGLGQVLDFKTEEDSIDLFINNADNVISTTELLLDLFKTLIADQYNSKLERVLRHTIYLLLTAQSFNFITLRKLLLDLEFRNNLIKEYEDYLPISIIDFFLTDYNDLKTKSFSEAISPLLAFIDEMDLVPVFNQEVKQANLEDVIKNNFLTVFSLDRTKLGSKVTKTIAGLIMEQLLTIMEQRTIDSHIILVIDEVAVVENPILSRYFAEARKYNLSLVLISQYLQQISEELKNSIFANVSNYFIFRVSKLDASLLADNLSIKIPSDDTVTQKIKLLSELENRECLARLSIAGKLMPVFKSTTVDYESIPRLKKSRIANYPVKPPKKTKPDFVINTDINLKDILKRNSTSKKGV